MMKKDKKWNVWMMCYRGQMEDLRGGERENMTGAEKGYKERNGGILI